MSSAKSVDSPFISDVCLESQVTPHCFPAGATFWPTSQPRTASKPPFASPGSAARKPVSGHCRKGEDTGGQGWGGGAGGVLREESSEPAVCRERWEQDKGHGGAAGC